MKNKNDNWFKLISKDHTAQKFWKKIHPAELWLGTSLHGTKAEMIQDEEFHGLENRNGKVLQNILDRYTIILKRDPPSNKTQILIRPAID